MFHYLHFGESFNKSIFRVTQLKTQINTKVIINLFQENQIKIKPTTSALIAARKKEFLETNNMKGRQMYDHVQDDFKNVSCSSTVTQ